MRRIAEWGGKEKFRESLCAAHSRVGREGKISRELARGA